MFIKQKRGWEISEQMVTDEAFWVSRRSLIKNLTIGAICGLGGSLEAFASSDSSNQTVSASKEQIANRYPAKRNPLYTHRRLISEEADVTSYNNFYEFGSHKSIARAAQALKTRPWTVTIDGMVESPKTIDVDDLINQMQLEERVYRFRCVEAWSMVVPWTGFPLSDLIKLARPNSSAKYVKMQTFLDPEMSSGQKQHWYPWPYSEGLTMPEGLSELAFLATGVYGKPLPKQMGAPLRLVVPWKYGFKSIKSIVRFTFTDKRPISFWEEIQPSEYGFWANVNPEVDHPRWSQAIERTLAGPRIPTKVFNGYGEFVANLYDNMKGERLFR